MRTSVLMFAGFVLITGCDSDDTTHRDAGGKDGKTNTDGEADGNAKVPDMDSSNRIGNGGENFCEDLREIDRSVTSLENDSGLDDEPQEVNGYIEIIEGIPVLRLWGSREEIGYAQGALLCRQITESIEAVFEYMIPSSDHTLEELYETTADTTLIPEGDRLEMEGIIQGLYENCSDEDLIITNSHIDPNGDCSWRIGYRDLVIVNTTAEWYFGCSSLTVWGEASASSGTLHARNLDLPSGPTGRLYSEVMLKVYSSDDEGGIKLLSVTYPSLIGCTTCFTEKGTGMTTHHTDWFGSAESGVVPKLLSMRAALVATEGSEDPIGDAEQVLEANPQAVGSNFHLSLPCNKKSECIGGVVFEYDGDNSNPDGLASVRVPGDVDDGLQTSDAIVCTNHFRKRPNVIVPVHSSIRYDALVAGINNSLSTGGIDTTSALELLQITSDIIDNITIYSTITDSADMSLKLYVGSLNGRGAPYYDPHEFSLSEIFSGFPE